MLARTTLFLSNRSQAVRLPKAVAFDPGLKDVVIIPDGVRRIIAPAHSAWNDFFSSSGTELPERNQPVMQDRESF